MEKREKLVSFKPEGNFCYRPMSSLEDRIQYITVISSTYLHVTGILSQIRTKLRDWAVWQAGAGCLSRAALPSNDSKTLYGDQFVGRP